MRCYITLLACGWLLLEPPMKTTLVLQAKMWLERQMGKDTIISPEDLRNRIWVGTEAPLSDWRVVASSESLAECMRIRAENYDKAARNAATYQRPPEEYNRAMRQASRCIPSDAIKLQ